MLNTDIVDSLLPDAVELVIHQQTGSISMLQRKLGIGYTRAARIIDKLEAKGIIGEHEGSKRRLVLKKEEELDDVLNSLLLEHPELSTPSNTYTSDSLVEEESISHTFNTVQSTYHQPLEKSKHIEEELVKLQSAFDELQDENTRLKAELSFLQEENNSLRDRWKKKRDEFSTKYREAENEFEFTKNEMLKEYNQLLIVRDEENNKIIDDLLSNEILEKLQEQYQVQLSSYDKNIRELNRMMKQQRENIELMRGNQFTLAREIVTSTETFVKLLRESLETHHHVDNKKLISLSDELVPELLEIFETALNDITPLFSYKKKISSSKLGKIRGHIEDFFFYFQTFFMKRDIVPPDNMFLVKINDFMLDEDNYYPTANVIFLFYGALLMTLLSKHETCEIVSIDYIIERNRERVEKAFNDHNKSARKQPYRIFNPYRIDPTPVPFENIKEYLLSKLAIYSGLGKIHQNLYVNSYIQDILGGFRKNIADRFVYDEMILETYKDKNTFYISGCEETGIYKFGVTSKNALVRLDANSRLAYRDLNVKEFKLFKELATNHALAIEQYFVEVFAPQSQKLNYGKEWVILEEAEAQYLLHGIWEQDEKLKYILSSSPEV